MPDRGIKRNASGYYDGTAFQAVTSGPAPGEIWVSSRDGESRLILANNGALCSCLKLYPDYQDGEVRVMARVPMYANPMKPAYARTADLTQYIKSIPDADFKIIHRAVGKALGLTKERASDGR